MTAPHAAVPPLHGDLLSWYERTARALPWRHTRDPYRILVSEIMLQQTQASRVEAPYEAFLTRFPTVAALAAAPVADVVRAWRGLGYNRRAVALQRAAQAVVDQHDGRVPRDLAALRALPGVGDYTARAVLAFAFDAAAAPVDTNVARVLARAVAGAPLTRRAAQQLADATMVPGQPAAWSHALMDLGARICTAREARCAACPIAAHCAWHTAGRPPPDPAAGGALRPRRQGRFRDSDRYHRGRIVAALRRESVPRTALGRVADLDDAERLEFIVRGLVVDGLAIWNGDALQLPFQQGAPQPAPDVTARPVEGMPGL